MLRRFATALLWFAIWAWVVANGTQVSFWLIYPALLAYLLVIGVTVLLLAMSWATARATRLPQFRLVTLLTVVFLVALFFAGVRWLTVSSSRVFRGDDQVDLTFFVNVAIASTIIAVSSITFLAALLESLVWTAVWLVRKRTKSVHRHPDG